MKLRYALLFCLFIITGTTNAQETDSLKMLMGLIVSSPSLQAEKLEESPVPITIITQTEIERLPVKNLRDLLTTMVPGFTNVQDQNEYNVAMRGVFGSSQQKILILVNGHRLNSRSYSEANPDFGISLKKIKKIEIMRGPGSSIYGNVALTAVINIFTKETSDYNNGILELGIGNYFQRQASINFGSKFSEKKAFTFWAETYLAKGEDFQSDQENGIQKQGTAKLGAFTDWPSWDIGGTLKLNNTSILLNTRNSHYIAPYTSGGITGESYNLSDFPNFMGISSGLSSTSFHFDLKNELTTKRGLRLLINPYMNFYHYIGYTITTPIQNKFVIPMWGEFTEGLNLNVKRNYTTSNSKGNVILGFQFDHFDILYSHMPSGAEGKLDSFTYIEKQAVLELGSEHTVSLYGQSKHYFSDKFLSNTGVRLDLKHRKNGDVIVDISPRIALVYIPCSSFDMKLSYSQSFVDAPYWYRYNSLPAYTGSENLLPEHLYSFQLTPTFYFPNQKMTNVLNLFYNVFKDVVIRDPHADLTGVGYINQGKYEATGIENELLYKGNKLHVKHVFSYMRSVRSNYNTMGNQYTLNIPQISSVLNFSVNLFKLLNQKVWLTPQIHYTSLQKSPIVGAIINGTLVTNEQYTVPQKTIINLALNYETLRHIQLKLQVTNILDTYYEQGGTVRFPYPQPGRWMNFYLGYRF